MKAWKMLICVSTTLLVALLLEGCATGKHVPTADEELYGTWTNENEQPQKLVYFLGGFKQYWLVSDRGNPWEEETTQIAGKWKDSDGNVWYKTLNTATGGWNNVASGNFQMLQKISKSGTVIELTINPVVDFDFSSFPTTIDPNDSTYCIYYRAKD